MQYQTWTSNWKCRNISTNEFFVDMLEDKKNKDIATHCEFETTVLRKIFKKLHQISIVFVYIHVDLPSNGRDLTLKLSDSIEKS